MIKSFKNKFLEKFDTDGKEEGLENVDTKRLRLILSQLDAADELRDCKIQSFKFTRIKKNGIYSIYIEEGKKLVFKLTPSKEG